MAAVEIAVYNDMKFWGLSFYVKCFSPCELYRWLKTLRTQDFHCIHIQRELKTSHIEPNNQSLRRCQSLPDLLTTKDVQKWIPTEMPIWYTVRLLKKFEQKDNVDPSFLVNRTFRNSGFLPWINLVDRSDTRATYEGARGPTRRKNPVLHEGKANYNTLNQTEKRNLRVLLDSQRNSENKQVKARIEFQNLVKCEGDEAVSFKSLREIANANDLMSGHWTYYGGILPQNANRDDETWQRLLYSFFFGPLSAETVTQLQFKRTPDGRSISVTNPLCLAMIRDLEINEMDRTVASVEKAIRYSGIRYSKIKYKADVFSACQITHANPITTKKLRPTIYASEYNPDKLNSEIRTDYTVGYVANVTFGQQPTGEETVWHHRDMTEEKMKLDLRMPRRMLPRSYLTSNMTKQVPRFRPG